MGSPKFPMVTVSVRRLADRTALGVFGTVTVAMRRAKLPWAEIQSFQEACDEAGFGYEAVLKLARQTVCVEMTDG